jgi:hypothetical protein
LGDGDGLSGGGAGVGVATMVPPQLSHPPGASAYLRWGFTLTAQQFASAFHTDSRAYSDEKVANRTLGWGGATEKGP